MKNLKCILIYLLFFSPIKIYAQAYKEISLTYFTQSYNIVSFINFKTGNQNFLYTTGPGVLLGGRPYIKDGFQGVRLAYLNRFAWYPNGMKNRFNLFLHASLENIYYRTEIDDWNPPDYRKIIIEKRWYIDNSFQVGFGFQVRILKNFSFSVAAGLGPFYEYDKIITYDLSDQYFTDKLAALDFGINWRFK
jgi:hypothetical protein